MDSLGYFGLSLQVGDFGLDIYLTQLIFGAVEVPARYSSIFMMQWFGRRWSQMGTLVLGGLMCISIIFVPTGAWTGSPLAPPTLTHLWPEAHGFSFQNEGFPGVKCLGRWGGEQGPGDGLSALRVADQPPSPDLPVVGTVLAIVGKFATAAGFTISYVYSAELFPTIIR